MKMKKKLKLKSLIYFLFPLVDRNEIRQMGKQSWVGNVRLLQTLKLLKITCHSK